MRTTPAVRQGLAVAAATGLYGVSFGALAVGSGLTVWQTVALSALMFTGGSQFAFVAVVGAGGTGLAATTAATLLGVRNAIYGMQVKALLRPTTTWIPLTAHLTIDESTATASAQVSREEERRGFWAAGVGVWVFWNASTVAGALAGASLGDPRAWGLDGAAAAAFLGLLWPRLHGRDPVAIAVAAAAVTLVTLPLTPPGIPVILAALVSAATWWRQHRRSVP